MKYKSNQYSKYLLIIIILFSNSLTSFSQEFSIPLLIDKGQSVKNRIYPLGVGVPFPKNFLKKENLALLNVISDKSGTVPSNIEIRSLWNDEYVQWVWIDFEGDPFHQYKLVMHHKKSLTYRRGIKLIEDKNQIQVDTGKIKIKFVKNKSTPTKVSIKGRPTIKGDGFGVYLVTHKDEMSYASGSEAELEWEVETHNPQRTVIRIEGNYILAGEAIARMILRYDFFNKQSFFKMEHRLIITKKPSEVSFKEYGITMPMYTRNAISYFGVDHQSVELEGHKNKSTWVFQKDYPRWSIQDKICHIGRNNDVNSIYQVADGWAEAYHENKKIGVVLGIKNFAETFPKELLINKKGITAKLWSGRSGISLDYHPKTRLKHFLGEKYLQETYWYKSKVSRDRYKEKFLETHSDSRGSARTHKLICNYYSERKEAEAMIINHIIKNPATVLAAPKWSLSTGVFPKISAKNTKMFPKEEEYISTAFDDLLIKSKDYPLNGWYSFGLCPAIRYGYFNKYGKWSRAPRPGVKFVPEFYRLSYIEGYNTTRHAWYLWVRSGERKYLDFIEKQNNALIDYRFSNYGPQKGLINDSRYAAPIYWPGSDGYNLKGFGNDDSLAPLWMDYYLRDNRSAKNILEYFTEAVPRHWDEKLYNNISPGMLCQLLMSAWRVTKSPELEKRFSRIVNDLIDPNSKVGLNVYFYKYFRKREIPPGPEREKRAYYKIYRKLGGAVYEYMRDFPNNKKASLTLKRASEELLTHVTHDLTLTYQNYLPILMLDYYEKSGKKEYLGAITQALLSSMHNDLQNKHFKFMTMYKQTFPLYVVPHLLRILEKENGIYPDFPIIGNSSEIKKGSIYLIKNKNKSVKLRVGLNADINKTNHFQIKAKIYLEDNTPFREFRITELPSYDGSYIVARWYELEIPEGAPSGTYRIDFSPNNFLIYSSNVERIVMHMPYGINYSNRRTLSNKKCYFNVPHNQDSFRLKINGDLQIYNPDGYKEIGKRNSNGELYFQSKNKAGLWYFILEKNIEVNFIDTLPVITMGKKSKFFIPKGVSNTKFSDSYFPNWIFLKKSLDATTILVHKINTKPTVTFQNGKMAPDDWIQYDAKNKMAEIEFSDPLNNILSIQVKNQEQMSVIYPETVQVMSYIPEGILWNKKIPKKLFFKVGSNDKSFDIYQNLSHQELLVTSHLDKEFKIKGDKTTIDITNQNGNQPWSISINNKASRYKYVKIDTLSPMVAYSTNDFFEIPKLPIRTQSIKKVEESIIFTQGVFKEALHLNKKDKLTIPLGQKISTHARKGFNAQKGTIEFFFMLNSDPRFSKSTGIPFAVPIDKSQSYEALQNHFISFTHKNTLRFMLPWKDIKSKTAAELGPRKTNLGMLKLEAGRWYHLAISWDCNKELLHLNQKTNKFICKVYLDGKAITFKRWRIERMPKGFSAPLPGEFIQLQSHNHDILIDELRISHEPRIELNEDPVQKYPVPKEAFKYDNNTSILMHFDSEFEAIGKDGQKILTQWEDDL